MDRDQLSRHLADLEAEYPNQPIIARQADYSEIAALREQLGLPPFAPPAPPAPAAPPPARLPDHTAARVVYQAYLAKVKDLSAHQAYADAVAQATSGGGMTPVRPLATMGTGGGPLRCDHCGKPMVLEGGRFDRVAADVAWATATPAARGRRWASYVRGGMVVEIQTNGTLRVYHGYPNQPGCATTADRADKKARETFRVTPRPDTRPALRAFLAHDFPAMPAAERDALVAAVWDAMYGYDPGVGTNRPPESPLPPDR